MTEHKKTINLGTGVIWSFVDTKCAMTEIVSCRIQCFSQQKKKLHGQFMDFSRELAIFASLLSARKMKPHPTESPGSRGVEVPRTHWSAQNVLKSRVAMVEINPLIGSLSHQIHRSQNPPKNPTRRAQICKTRKVGSSWSLCP